MTKAPIIEHDTWLYRADGTSRLFSAGELHPGEGWLDEPTSSIDSLSATGTSLEAAQADQKAKFDAAWDELSAERDLLAEENENLRAEIADLKAQIAKFDGDGDGDGKPGGRAAKA